MTNRKPRGSLTKQRLVPRLSQSMIEYLRSMFESAILSKPHSATHANWLTFSSTTKPHGFDIPFSQTFPGIFVFYKNPVETAKELHVGVKNVIEISSASEFDVKAGFAVGDEVISHICAFEQQFVTAAATVITFWIVVALFCFGYTTFIAVPIAFGLSLTIGLQGWPLSSTPAGLS